MRWILFLALLLTGCAAPMTLAYKATIVAYKVDKLDRTPEEELADIDWWIKANRKWCRKGGEQSACQEVVKLLAQREYVVMRMGIKHPTERQKEAWRLEN